jgi:hypothetical protein
MGKTDEFLDLTVSGQTFRLRAAAVDADRAKRVAQAIESQMRKHKMRGAYSDLRAALMTAYEIGYELDEQVHQAAPAKASGEGAGLSVKTLDRLLATIDKAIEPGRAPSRSAKTTKRASGTGRK